MDFLRSFGRHGLTFLGGILVAKGIVDPETANSFISAGTEVVGGLLVYGLGQAFSLIKLFKK